MLNFEKMTKWLCAVMALSMLSGCGPSGGTDDASNAQANTTPSDSSASGSKEVTVYASLPDYELPTYFNAFEQDTGIKVNYVRLSSGEMLSRIEAEKENPNASVMYGGGNDIYITASERGLLEPYESPELVNVSDEFKDPDGVYTPVSYGVISFVCNKDWFEKNNLEYPTSWQDLLKPEFKNQISMSHPSTASTGYSILASVVQLMGEEEGLAYMQALNQNVRQYTRAGAAPCADVGLGEAAIGISYAQDALSVASEGYPIELSFPKEGTRCEVVACALIKNGSEEEQENARLLIDWLISKRAQELYIDSNSFRTPVNVTAEKTPGLPEPDDLVVLDYDSYWAAQNMDRLNEQFMELVNDGAALEEN